MTQKKEWEREYERPTFLTKDNLPQKDVVRFVQFLRKQYKKVTTGQTNVENTKIENTHMLDLGSGVGRNSFYFAELGAEVVGLEISETAVQTARAFAEEAALHITYIVQSIGDIFPLLNESTDLVLDITSSNSLTESERETYLTETYRVLKPHGYFFVKALCKDGDDNAKQLLKGYSGKECDTYIMPHTGIVERVWSREDFIHTYETYFQILSLEKKTTYTRMNNRVYKRNFWLCYMQKIV